MSSLHEAALATLPWVIAALPFTLLVVSAAIGVWPHPITVAVHVAIIFGVIAVDVRLLLRASAAMSFMPALRTPFYYLYRRGWRTGRERAAVILAAVTTAIWLLALGAALLGVVDRAARHPDVAITANADSVTHAAVEVTDAVVVQLQTPSKKGLQDVHEAAEGLTGALDGLEAVLDFASFAENEEQAVAEIRETAGRVGVTAEDLAQARSPFELKNLLCPVAVETRDFVIAMTSYLESGDQPSAKGWSETASAWEAAAAGC